MSKGKRRQPKPKKRDRKTKAKPPKLTWLGAVVRAPLGPSMPDDVPSLVIWVERPSGARLGIGTQRGGDATGALGELLKTVLVNPDSGPRRRPARVRVADEAHVPEVRAVLGADFPVSVGTTPEIDALVAEIELDVEPEDDLDDRWVDSYLEGEDMTPEVVQALYDAAADLYRQAPWAIAADTQVIRVDIPQLGIDGVCVALLGFAKEHYGLVLYPSYDDFDDFSAAAEEIEHGTQVSPADFRVGQLLLSLDPRETLTTTMKQEVMKHGWRASHPDAYPTLLRIHNQPAPLPASAREYRMASLVASHIGAFCENHRALFATGVGELARQSFTADDGVEIRFTAPFAPDPSTLQQILPRIQNTDGHQLIVATDYLSFAADQRDAVLQKLASIDDETLDVQVDEEGDSTAVSFVATAAHPNKSMHDTLLGRASVRATRMSLESNSSERADALLAAVVATCGDLVKQQTRSLSDPLSGPNLAATEAQPYTPITLDAGELQMVMKFKQQHYARWPDDKLPALKGKTPRQAVKTKKGRQEVAALLQDMAKMEEQGEPPAFDFSTLFDELGL